ncbi:radical SAM protein [Spirochaetota bacterium]
MSSKYLFINPPVQEFSCSNFYSLPYGMIHIMSEFIRNDIEFCFYDFLHEDFSYHDEKYKYKPNGTCQYPEKDIEKPIIFKDLHRRYKRFGNSIASFDEFTKKNKINMEQTTCFVSLDFTYRALSIINFIDFLHTYGIKNEHIVIGGTAALLIKPYLAEILPGIRFYSPALLNDITGKKLQPGTDLYAPDLSVYKTLSFIPFRISRYCPFTCSYCANEYLSEYNSKYFDIHIHTSISKNKSSEYAKTLKGHIKRYSQRFNTNIAVPLDDAFLYNIDVIEQIFTDNTYKIYTPNGIHIHKIDPVTAPLLKKAGLAELRFGIESIGGKHQELSNFKLNNVDINKKIDLLIKAGFEKKQIRFYILYGLFDQTFKDVMDTIEFLKKTGCRINASGFSPVPYTEMYDRLNKKTDNLFDLHPELANNNTVPLWNREFTEDKVDRIKRLVNDQSV